MSKIIKFTNCNLIKEDGIEYKDFWINGSQISNKLEHADIIIDCKQLYFSPGFIDLQINGGWGYNFSSSDEDVNVAISSVSKELVKAGVTSYLPTIITSSKETYRKILPKIKCKQGSKDNGASILGIHLEGPFISSCRKGAHPEEFILDKFKIHSIDQLKECYGSLDNVSIITIAPEICEPSLFKQLKQSDIVVSLGHTNCNFQEAELAIRKYGCNLITHLYNAMPPFHHRNPGIIGCLTSNIKNKSIDNYDLNNNLMNDLNDENKQLNGQINGEKNEQLYYGVICDNVHTHEAALRFAYQANPEGFICVTDAVAPMGLESNKKHMIGDLLIEIKGNKAMICDTNTLCGSIVQLDQCIRNFKNATNCSLEEAIASATSRPAKAINCYPKKGSLSYAGADGDFLIMTKDLEILATFINGELVWNNLKLLSYIPDFNKLLS